MEATREIKNRLTKKGYVYYGSKNSKFFHRILPPTNEGVPGGDNFYIAATSMTIRGFHNKSSSDYYNENGSVKEGWVVYVDEVITSGHYFWIKINYNPEAKMN